MHALPVARFYPGNAHGFIGPLKPPSVSADLREARWYSDHSMSTSYAWGRHDAGERRDANDIYAFGEAWADAQWAFRHDYRAFLPSMSGAYVRFFAGEGV